MMCDHCLYETGELKRSSIRVETLCPKHMAAFDKLLIEYVARLAFTEYAYSMTREALGAK